MAVLRRFKDLGATQIQSIYGWTGLLERRVVVPSTSVKAYWPHRAANGSVTSFTLVQAEANLASELSRRERERALSRSARRLGEAKTDWEGLSQDEKELLLLSNKEFAVRYPNGPAAAEGGADEEE